jgi:hypothetical protein
MDRELQLPLPMLTWYSEGKPRLVPIEVVRSAPNFRDAVRACWNLRTRRNMTRRQLAEEIGVPPSHLTDYLSELPDKRDMPAKYVEALEIACQNRFVTQWFTHRAELTHLEQVLLERRAA